jgi:glycosyltransferase involved in cell wall biosynthesis
VEGKGFLDILEAIKQINIRDPKKRTRLSIAGEGPLRDRIESYVRVNKMNDYVRMMGWLSVDEMRDAYRTADAYIGAPRVGADGRKEAFGNVYAEAMACGTPAIVTTDAGASEIMTNKVSGLVVEPGNIYELAEAICYLRDNPDKAHKMGQSAAIAVAPYSKTATRDKYIEIINELQK